MSVFKILKCINPDNKDNWNFYVKLVFQIFNNKTKTQIHDNWENLKGLHFDIQLWIYK